MLVVLSSQFHLKLPISCGKIQSSIKTQPIKMVKKEVLLRCLAGHMLTSKQNAKHWAKWAGWESKYFQLKSLYFHMSGHKMAN